MFLGNSELACLNLTFTGHSGRFSLFVAVWENYLHMSSAPTLLGFTAFGRVPLVSLLMTAAAGEGVIFRHLLPAAVLPGPIQLPIKP